MIPRRSPSRCECGASSAIPKGQGPGFIGDAAEPHGERSEGGTALAHGLHLGVISRCRFFLRPGEGRLRPIEHSPGWFRDVSRDGQEKAPQTLPTSRGHVRQFLKTCAFTRCRYANFNFLLPLVQPAIPRRGSRCYQIAYVHDTTHMARRAPRGWVVTPRQRQMPGLPLVLLLNFRPQATTRVSSRCVSQRLTLKPGKFPRLALRVFRSGMLRNVAWSASLSSP